MGFAYIYIYNRAKFNSLKSTKPIFTQQLNKWHIFPPKIKLSIWEWTYSFHLFHRKTFFWKMIHFFVFGNYLKNGLENFLVFGKSVTFFVKFKTCIICRLCKPNKYGKTRRTIFRKRFPWNKYEVRKRRQTKNYITLTPNTATQITKIKANKQQII